MSKTYIICVLYHVCVLSFCFFHMWDSSGFDMNEQFTEVQLHGNLHFSEQKSPKAMTA